MSDIETTSDGPVPELETTTTTTTPAAPVAGGSALWREIKGMLWVLLAVLAFHSFVAKPFYIPSESMMPGLLKGDRLVVSKYPYGWSYVSPTIPNPAAIFRSVLLGSGEPWGITLPFTSGRVLSNLPKRGDVVIVTPPGSNEDYIKRVIGLPGDTLEVRGGRLILNGVAVKSEVRPPTSIPIDSNMPCGNDPDPMHRDYALMEHVAATTGGARCELPIVRETLPNGVTYDTVDLGQSEGDNYPATKIPAGHLFLMGDNRDRSADSRVPLESLGLGGPVPFENIGGRAEFITFSLDGTTRLTNPASWFGGFRSHRAGTSLRASAAPAATR